MPTGRVDLRGRRPQLPDTPQPLKATLNGRGVRIRRPAGDRVHRTADPQSAHAWLGIKPLFSGSEWRRTAARPRVRSGGRQWQRRRCRRCRNLKYRLIRRTGTISGTTATAIGTITSSSAMAARRAATVGTLADKPVKIGGHVDWGSYRLEVFDPATGCGRQLSLLCRLVRGAGHQLARRTSCRSSTDKELYRAGDIAKIAVKPPFAGKMTVLIATDRICETRTVDVTAEGTSRDSRRAPTGAPAPMCWPPPIGPTADEATTVPAAPSAWPGWASTQPTAA